MHPSRPVLLAALLFAVPLFAGQQPTDVFRAKESPELAARVAKYREGLQASGYRVDEAAGTLLAPDTKAPITVARAVELCNVFEKFTRHSALERMALLLRQDGKTTDPTEKKRLEAIAAEGDVPLSVDNALKAHVAGDNAALNGAVWDGYLEQTRDIDALYPPGPVGGQPKPGWNSAPRGPGYFDDDEAALGVSLQQDMIERLSGSSVGREVLARFRKTDGSYELPRILVLKQDLDNAASYRPNSRTFTFNQFFLARKLLEITPRGERAAMAKTVNDPKALAALLRANPAVRKAFIAAHDDTVVHELAHAWQDKRGPLLSEIANGTVPNMDPLECEQEAYITQFRFLHEKLLTDPKGALASNYFKEYRHMMSDFEGWKTNLEQWYFRTSPGAAISLSAALELQTLREKAASETPWSPGGLSHTMTKLINYARGRSVIASEIKVYDRIFTRFMRDEYPRMRAESPERVTKAYLAVEDLYNALWTAPVTKTSDDIGARVEKACLNLLQTPVKSDRDRQSRLSIAALLGHRWEEAKKTWTKDFAELYVNIYIDEIRRVWEAGRVEAGAPDPQRLARALDGVEKKAVLSPATLKKLQELRAEEARRKSRTGGKS